MATFRLAVSLGSIALTAAALLGSAVPASAGAAPDRGILPPKNPARNVSPSPDFLSAGTCVGGQDSAGCNIIVLRAVNPRAPGAGEARRHVVLAGRL